VGSRLSIPNSVILHVYKKGCNNKDKSELKL
jgi:hypothetical protein